MPNIEPQSSGKSSGPKRLQNLEHYVRVHTVASTRGLGLFLLLSSTTFLIVASFSDIHTADIKLPGLINNLVSCSFVAIFAGAAFIPCRCGKVSHSNYGRLKRLLETSWQKSAHNAFKILGACLAANFVFYLVGFVLISLQPNHPDIMFSSIRLFSLLCGITTVLLGLALFFSTNIKPLKQRLDTAKLLTDADFGPEMLKGKSSDELNRLITAAIKQGDTEQAEMISQELLNQAERLRLE